MCNLYFTCGAALNTMKAVQPPNHCSGYGCRVVSGLSAALTHDRESWSAQTPKQLVARLWEPITRTAHNLSAPPLRR